MSARFTGKVLLVAGGTGGVGRAVTLAFLEENATAVVTYRRQEELQVLKVAAGVTTSQLDAIVQRRSQGHPRRRHPGLR